MSKLTMLSILIMCITLGICANQFFRKVSKIRSPLELEVDSYVKNLKTLKNNSLPIPITDSIVILGNEFFTYYGKVNERNYIMIGRIFISPDNTGNSSAHISLKGLMFKE